jgi:transcriptional regulator with XRE-family HTH domain
MTGCSGEKSGLVSALMGLAQAMSGEPLQARIELNGPKNSAYVERNFLYQWAGPPVSKQTGYQLKEDVNGQAGEWVSVTPERSDGMLTVKPGTGGLTDLDGLRGGSVVYWRVRLCRPDGEALSSSPLPWWYTLEYTLNDLDQILSDRAAPVHDCKALVRQAVQAVVDEVAGLYTAELLRWLKSQAEGQGVSQSQIARAIGVDAHTTVGRYLSGKVTLDLPHFVAICCFLGVHPADPPRIDRERITCVSYVAAARVFLAQFRNAPSPEGLTEALVRDLRERADRGDFAGVEGAYLDALVAAGIAIAQTPEPDWWGALDRSFNATSEGG